MECKTCDKRSSCKELCPEIEKMLPKAQTGRLKGEFMLSNDLIDRTFYKDEEGNIEQIKYKNPKDSTEMV